MNAPVFVLEDDLFDSSLRQTPDMSVSVKPVWSGSAFIGPDYHYNPCKA